ncbi:MAG: hypothetical protein L0Z50_25220 [Verrucomicrobiales bacterium]|nr:hypothetical protein [Verrucomicrobiales bacterium]
MTKTILILCLALPLCEGRTFALDPQDAPTQSSTADFDSMLESLRADARADKVAIITEVMKFNEEESSAFWPVYRRYEADLVKLNDQRVDLIKSYAEKFETLTDADAQALADQAFSIEARRTELKKKYYKEFNKVLPATVVTKFFQLEHRLDLLVDLQLALELPSLLVKPVARPSGN